MRRKSQTFLILQFFFCRHSRNLIFFISFFIQYPYFIIPIQALLSIVSSVFLYIIFCIHTSFMQKGALSLGEAPRFVCIVFLTQMRAAARPRRAARTPRHDRHAASSAPAARCPHTRPPRAPHSPRRRRSSPAAESRTGRPRAATAATRRTETAPSAPSTAPHTGARRGYAYPQSTETGRTHPASTQAYRSD